MGKEHSQNPLLEPSCLFFISNLHLGSNAIIVNIFAFFKRHVFTMVLL